MFSKCRSWTDRIGALFCAAVLASASSATAQAREEVDGPVIIVEAPRSVPMRSERSPYTGAPIVVTIVKIPARYGDLNLTNPADAARLMTRLDRVARDACGQLDQLFPLDPDPDCVGGALAKAKVAAKFVIAAAQKRSSRQPKRRRHS